MKGLALTLLWYQIPSRFSASHQYGVSGQTKSLGLKDMLHVSVSRGVIQSNK